MSIQIAVTVDPSAPNLREINSAIALLTAIKTGLVFSGAEVGGLPTGAISADDNPAAGTEYPATPSPAEAFGLNPSPAEAFGGAPAPNASTAATPTDTAPAATSTPAATNGVELDAKGMPWDNRIHSENKAKVQDGSWRYRRNLDPNVKATVEAQLRQAMAIPAGGAAPVPNAPPQAPAPSAPPSAGAASATPPIPTAPGSAAPAAPSPSPSTPATGAATSTATASGAPVNGFVDLVGRIGVLIADNKLTQDEVKAACLANGLADLPLLASRPDLVPNVAGVLSAMLAPKGFAL